MIRNCSKHATSRERGLRVGDTVRLPRQLGGGTVYKHTFEITAFMAGPLAHCAVVRRLADGFTKTVACHWITHYLDADVGVERAS